MAVVAVYLYMSENKCLLGHLKKNKSIIVYTRLFFFSLRHKFSSNIKIKTSALPTDDAKDLFK